MLIFCNVTKVRELMQRERDASVPRPAVGEDGELGPPVVVKPVSTSPSKHKAGTPSLLADGATVDEGEIVKKDPEMLKNIVAWLVVNSMRSEQTQWSMLCIQNVSNIYRKT